MRSTAECRRFSARARRAWCGSARNHRWRRLGCCRGSPASGRFIRTSTRRSTPIRGSPPFAAKSRRWRCASACTTGRGQAARLSCCGRPSTRRCFHPVCSPRTDRWQSQAIGRFHLAPLGEPSGWDRWFRAAGLDGPAFAQRGPLLADASLSTQATLLGHGVALGDLLLVHEELASGQLVQPFVNLSPCGAYFLVARDLAGLDECERAFADWVRAEIADSRQRMRRNGFG